MPPPLALLAPVQRHFRRQRMQALVSMFRITDGTEILDIGGTPLNWHHVTQRPRVILHNLEDAYMAAAPFLPSMQRVIGDGCLLPYADRSVDLVFCNSVIEHVGSWERQQQLASEIRRVARRYFVQTPARWYPVEPHVVTLFLHYLPRAWQTHALLRYASVWGLLRKPAPHDWEFYDRIRLLTKRELRALFPDATIIHERALGLTKSFLAIRL